MNIVIDNLILVWLSTYNFFLFFYFHLQVIATNYKNEEISKNSSFLTSTLTKGFNPFSSFDKGLHKCGDCITS